MISPRMKEFSRERLRSITNKFKEYYTAVYHSLSNHYSDSNNSDHDNDNRYCNVSIDVKKKYICSNVDKLDINDKTALAQIIIDRGHHDLLKETNEGCVINLNNVVDVAINQMYALMKYKISSE